MIDGLIGWAEAVQIVDQSAATVARAVYNKWFARYCVPEQLHWDRNTQFASALVAELCLTFGTDKKRTTPYRPQANKKCEQFNRKLVAMLRFAVQNKKDYSTGSRSSRVCYNRTARRFRNRLAKRRIASRTSARCARPSMSERRCRNRRATCEPSLLTSPKI